MSWLVSSAIQSLLSAMSEYYLGGSSSTNLETLIKKTNLAIIEQLNLEKEQHLEALRMLIKDCKDEKIQIESTTFIIPSGTREDFVRGLDDLEVVVGEMCFLFLGVAESIKPLEETPEALEHILKIAQFADRFAKKEKLTPESKQDLFRNLLLLQTQTIVNRGPGIFRGLMHATLASIQLEPSKGSKKVIWKNGYFEVRLLNAFTIHRRKDAPINALEPIGKLSILTTFKLCPVKDRWEWVDPHITLQEDQPEKTI